MLLSSNELYLLPYYQLDTKYLTKKPRFPNLGATGSTNSPGANFECSREATNPEGASPREGTNNPVGRATPLKMSWYIHA